MVLFILSFEMVLNYTGHQKPDKSKPLLIVLCIVIVQSMVYQGFFSTGTIYLGTKIHAQ